jgi:hypothetical protein
MKRLISTDNIKQTVDALSRRVDRTVTENFLLATELCLLAAKKEVSREQEAQITQKVLGVCGKLKRVTGIPQADCSMDSQIYSLIARNTIDTLVELHLQPLPKLDSSKNRETPPPMHLLFVDMDHFAFFESHLLVREAPQLEYQVRLLSYRADFKDIQVNQITNTLNNGCIGSPNFILVEKTKNICDNGETSISLRLIEDFEPVGSILQSEVLLSRQVGKNRALNAEAPFTLHVHFDSAHFGQEMDFCFQILYQRDLLEVQELVSVQLTRLFAAQSFRGGKLLIFKFNNPLFFKSIGSPLWFARRSDEFRVIMYNASPNDIELDQQSEQLLYPRDEIELVRRQSKQLLSQVIVRETVRLTKTSVHQVTKQYQKLISSVFERKDRFSLATEDLAGLRLLRLLKILDRGTARLEDLHPFSFVFPPLDPPMKGEWMSVNRKCERERVSRLPTPQGTYREPSDSSTR